MRPNIAPRRLMGGNEAQTVRDVQGPAVSLVGGVRPGCYVPCSTFSRAIRIPVRLHARELRGLMAYTSRPEPSPKYIWRGVIRIAAATAILKDLRKKAAVPAFEKVPCADAADDKKRDLKAATHM